MAYRQWRWGKPIFARFAPKSVTMATSLERWQKNIRLVTYNIMFTYPEKLVKVGPVHFEIIGLQGTDKKEERRWKKVGLTSAKRKPFSTPMPGGLMIVMLVIIRQWWRVDDACEQAGLYCTPDKAKKITASLLFASLSAQAVKDIIWYHADEYTSIIVVQIFLVLLIVILPVALLVINLTVVREVRRQSHNFAERLHSLPHQQTTTSSNSDALSAMLLATSLMHVAVCGTWFTLGYVYLWTQHADLSRSTRTALHEVCLIAGESQSFVMSTAFYVYFIRGKQFRSELHKLFCHCGSAAPTTAVTDGSESRRRYADSGV